jgi:hypothetical protein
MAEPVPASQTLLSVTLPVQFKDGQLWRARYPSLIRDDLVPELQFEPAFQVFSDDPCQQVEVLFQIVDDEDAAFAAVGGEVSWQSLVPDNPAPCVEVELVNGNKECLVRWTRSDAGLTALRIVCQPLVRRPDQWAASDRDAEALTQVEGGVYLTIIDRRDAQSSLAPLRNPAPPGKPGRVRVVGIDLHSRPVYDLFFEGSGIPHGLSPEPAFRAGHGESLEFHLALDLPEGPFADVCFKTEDSEVAWTYVVPSERPDSLVGSPAAEENRLCKLQWRASPCTAGTSGTACTRGRVASLYAQLDAERHRDSLLRAAIASFSVDPTVIEPPACDASGVCTKPRDQVW